jgi:hypothetical protein
LAADYVTRLSLKCLPKKEYLRQILNNAQEKGIVICEADVNMNFDILQGLLPGMYLIMGEDAFRFYWHGVDQRLSMSVTGYQYVLVNDYKHETVPDHIEVLKILFLLSEDFLIKSLNIYSEYGLLMNEKGFNSLVASVALGNQSEDEDDAEDLIEQFENYGYLVSNEHGELSPDDIKLNIISMIKSCPDSRDLILTCDGFKCGFLLKSDTVILTPLAPYKTKRVINDEGIDMAFYCHILFNIFENFGIHELKSDF